jgi:hyperosmotically inducible periplasmic protein
MARARESGIIRLLLAVVLVAVIGGGAYLWELGSLRLERLERIDVGSLPGAVVRLLGSTRHALSNGWTTTRVETALALSKRVRARSIDVETNGAEVTLTGVVPRPEAKAAALTIAADIDGVERVVDRIAIDTEPGSAGPGTAANRKVADLEIQVRVYEDLLRDDVIHAEGIYVHVQDGVVTLDGSVPTEIDERYAEAIARSVPDVESVVSKLVVAPT